VEAANTFVGGRDPWLARLGNLRNVVRQELVARQLAGHLPEGALHVLDVGAGQGTQALRLAVMGHQVTAVEPDARMRAAFADAARLLPLEARVRVRLLAGDVTALDRTTRPAAYDVVLCHGVLMYLPAAGPAVAALASRLAPGGLLSLVARNGDAMAWRPALRRDWAATLTMLDEVEAARIAGRDAAYRNELGVDARADTVASLVAACRDAGLEVERWYGIRVATDGVPVDEPAPGGAELSALLEVEERLGRTDPYRQVATLLHVVARRPGPD
jgi:SAM-dependent methyltransferase